jgi:Uma2 family endonuclease
MSVSPATSEARVAPRYHGRPVTREEYLDLADDGFQYNMEQGVLYVAPSHDPEHGKLQLDFGSELREFLRKHSLGQVMVEVDALLPDGGDVVRPDISFVRSERARILLKHIHGAPDLICEVLSDSTRARDLGEKADRYLKSGVREYWIVDSSDRSIQLWINRGESWEKRAESVLQSELLPGFSIDVPAFFT